MADEEQNQEEGQEQQQGGGNKQPSQAKQAGKQAAEQAKKAAQEAVKKAIKEAAKKALMKVVMSPYGLLIIGIIILILFIVIILFAAFSGFFGKTTPQNPSTKEDLRQASLVMAFNGSKEDQVKYLVESTGDAIASLEEIKAEYSGPAKTLPHAAEIVASCNELIPEMENMVGLEKEARLKKAGELAPKITDLSKMLINTNCPESARSKGSDAMDRLKKLFGSSKSDVEAELVDVPLIGINDSATIKLNKKAAPCFTAALIKIGLMREAGSPDFNQEVRDYNFKSWGGYDWRQNANNPSLLSLHSFGIAFDLNPAENPNCNPSNPVGTQSYCQDGGDIPDAVVKAFSDYGFRWGGDYTNVKDYMHFEYLGEPSSEVPA